MEIYWKYREHMGHKSKSFKIYGNYVNIYGIYGGFHKCSGNPQMKENGV